MTHRKKYMTSILATVISKCCDMKCYFWRVGKMYLMEKLNSWLPSVYFCKQKNQHPAVTQNDHYFKYVDITLPSCLLAAGMRSSSGWWLALVLITCLSYKFLYILIISVVQLRHFPFRWMQYPGCTPPFALWWDKQNLWSYMYVHPRTSWIHRSHPPQVHSSNTLTGCHICQMLTG